MPEPISTNSGLLNYLMLLLRQFVGGPGPLENNLVRFGLPAMLWAGLWVLAWNRRRQGGYPREQLLVWGFGFGFLREFFMFIHVSLRITDPSIHQTVTFLDLEPLEHTLGMISIIVVAGSFIGYILQNERLTRIYLLSGLSATAVSYAITATWWSRQISITPNLKFHQSWVAWVFHVAASVLILVAIRMLSLHRSWLSSVVNVALLFRLLGEAIMLANFATQRTYAPFICLMGNALHMLAIPLLGYVYLREQTVEKQQAQAELVAYRDHLEVLVEARTAALEITNEQFRREIHERQETQSALERLSHSHTLILNSAGEGVFGVGVGGEHTFVNRAAAGMLGYRPEELIGEPSHATWHHSYVDGTPYPEGECPLHHGYKNGLVLRGDDQILWRRDGTSFPADYVSTPIFEQEELKGAVVIFRDITDRKRAEAEITRLYEETQRWAEELSALHRAGVSLNESLELPEVYSLVTREAMHLLDCQAALLCLWDSRENELVPVLARGIHASNGGHVPAVLSSRQKRYLTQVMHERQLVAVTDVDQVPASAESCPACESVRALLVLPLWSADRPLGCVFLTDTRAPRAWRSDEIALAEGFANLAALVIEKAQLHRQAERAAVLEERQRIAGDVHDGLAQTLSYLGLQVDSLIEKAGADSIEDVLETGDGIRRIIDQTSRSVRFLIADLQTAPEPPRCLQQLLQDTIAALPADARLEVAFETSLETPISLSPEKAEQVMRIVQEALLNVQQHAHAPRASVALHSAGGELAITIVDNGRGFDMQQPAPIFREHFGLSIMRARAARIAGQLDIHTTTGEGTRITLRWPNTLTPARDIGESRMNRCAIRYEAE